MTGKILGCSTLKDKQLIILDVETDARALTEKFYDKELEIEIKVKREKRSLSANGYLWTLLNEIAVVLGTSKEEVYRELVRRMGLCTPITVETRSADIFLKSWLSQGLGWQADLISVTETETEYLCYYGSSVYDVMQFSRLLDEVINEAQELDIPTDTPDKIAEIKSLYRMLCG